MIMDVPAEDRLFRKEWKKQTLVEFNKARRTVCMGLKRWEKACSVR